MEGWVDGIAYGLWLDMHMWCVSLMTQGGVAARFSATMYKNRAGVVTGYGGAAAAPLPRRQLQAHLARRRGRRFTYDGRWKTPRKEKLPELQVTTGEAARHIWAKR